MISGQRIAVVLPAFNSAQTLQRTVADLPSEVDIRILVDDGSADETVSIARRLGLTTFAHGANYGYGRNQMTCYREALKAGADIVVMVHPDYQYDPRLVVAMAGMVASGVYDVVLGSRILGGTAHAGGMPGYKYIANRVLTAAQNAALGAKLSEYHTGYRAFSRRVLETLPLAENSDDFAFDNQMLVQCLYFGFRIGELSCPTRYFPEASSINFRRSVRYGVSVLAATGQCVLQRMRLARFAIFDRDGRRLMYAAESGDPGVVAPAVPQHEAPGPLATPILRPRQALAVHAVGAAVCLMLGQLQAVVEPYRLSSVDAVSYLDVADSYAHRDWATALNGYWSPAYSWLLALAGRTISLAPEHEFLLFRLVNFVIYVGALAAFAYFIDALLIHRRASLSPSSPPSVSQVPDWALIAGGYALFAWSALRWISIGSDTPDLLAAAVIWVAAGLLLRSRRQPLSWISSVSFGALLGAAYLTKTAMFPVGLAFLATAGFWTWSWRRAPLRWLTACLTFVIVTGPFVLALSVQHHRLTIGDAGRLNYAWLVNPGGYAIPIQHWTGSPTGFGWPRHTGRLLWHDPDVFEFSAPIGGTFAPWTDPSYWFEGLKIHISPPGELHVMRKNLAFYRSMFLDGLLLSFAVLLFTGGAFRSLNAIRRNWVLLLPAAAGLAVYLVCTDLSVSNLPAQPSTRYVAPFVVLLFAAVASAVSLHAPRWGRTAAPVLLAAMMVFGGVKVASLAAGELTTLSQATEEPLQMRVAAELSRRGVLPGDHVAIVGREYDHAFWARELHARIVVQIPDERWFMRTDPASRAQILHAIGGTSARWLIARPAPDLPVDGEWTAIDSARYFLLPIDHNSDN